MDSKLYRWCWTLPLYARTRILCAFVGLGVKNFKILEEKTEVDFLTYERFGRKTLLALKKAMAQIGLKLKEVNLEKIGESEGQGFGGGETLELRRNEVALFQNRGVRSDNRGLLPEPENVRNHDDLGASLQ